MFDNLFCFAGPMGTSFVLAAVLFGAVALLSLGSRAAQMQGRRARL